MWAPKDILKTGFYLTKASQFLKEIFGGVKPFSEFLQIWLQRNAFFFYCKAMWNLRRFYYLFWFNLIKGKANSFWYIVWLSNIHPQFMAVACRIGCLKRLSFKLGKNISVKDKLPSMHNALEISKLSLKLRRPYLICLSTSNYVLNFE